MQDTLMEEKKKDEEIYEKMSCWCEVNDKEKTASIASAERAIDQLTSTIEEKTALSAQLKGEIEGLEEEMAKAKEAIETATAMRAEEKAEFTTEVKELSESEIALVNAKHDLKNTRKDLSADQKFLVDMKEKCSASDKEFDQRKKDREEEILAIGDALKILTEDSARDLFSSTLGFTQVKTKTREAAVRDQISDVLKRAADKHADPKLSLLAVSAQLDAFTKVKAAIDEMITELKKQQEDEVQHKRWCNDELRKNEVEHKEKSWKFEDLTKANNVLADTIETLDSEMEVLRANVAENKRQIKRASEDREAT